MSGASDGRARPDSSRQVAPAITWRLASKQGAQWEGLCRSLEEVLAQRCSMGPWLYLTLQLVRQERLRRWTVSFSMSFSIWSGAASPIYLSKNTPEVVPCMPDFLAGNHLHNARQIAMLRTAAVVPSCTSTSPGRIKRLQKDPRCAARNLDTSCPFVEIMGQRYGEPDRAASLAKQRWN